LSGRPAAATLMQTRDGRMGPYPLTSVFFCARRKVGMAKKAVKKSGIDMESLSEAAGYSYEQLKPFRDNRKAALKEYVGKHYSENGSDDRVPINLLELAINIYLQRLVASCPRVSINTGVLKLREICERLKLAVNHLIENEIHLDDTLERGVSNALFSMGIVKCAMNREKVEYLGVMYDSGQPFAKCVSLDNWVHDMTVEDILEGQFMGDRYAVSVDDANTMFPGHEDDFIGASDMTGEDDKAHNMTDPSTPTRHEFEERVWLWDVWLPKNGVVITCLDSGDPGRPFGKKLKETPWYGIETGPYHLLGFNYVEGNTMPLSLTAIWTDLHELANSLFRKLGRQAVRQKTILGVAAGARKDGEKIVDAGDGDAVPMDNPDKAKEYNYGGIKPENLAFLIQVKDLFSYLAGNLDLMGGLSPQSDTATQDNLLSAGASQRIKRMQKKVYRWVSGICKALAFYIWTDPYINIPVVKRIPFIDDVQVVDRFGPDDDRNENDFMEYNLSIETYSHQHQGPEAKLQSLRTIFGEMIAPMLPIMAQAGIGWDFELFFRTIGELGNLPELDKMLVYADPKHEQQMVGEPPSKPATTKRTYERINRPGATQPGKDQILMQALLGGKPQTSEGASAFRPTG
jgi:hypothetical protein